MTPWSTSFSALSQPIEMKFCMQLDISIIYKFWEAHSIWIWESGAVTEKPIKKYEMFARAVAARLPAAYSLLLSEQGVNTYSSSTSHFHTTNTKWNCAAAQRQSTITEKFINGTDLSMWNSSNFKSPKKCSFSNLENSAQLRPEDINWAKILHARRFINYRRSF